MESQFATNPMLKNYFTILLLLYSLSSIKSKNIFSTNSDMLFVRQKSQNHQVTSMLFQDKYDLCWHKWIIYSLIGSYISSIASGSYFSILLILGHTKYGPFLLHSKQIFNFYSLNIQLESTKYVLHTFWPSKTLAPYFWVFIHLLAIGFNSFCSIGRLLLLFY